MYTIRKRIIIGILITLLCGILCASMFQNGYAAYTDTDDITIDGTRDSAYEKAFEGLNYTVYYANSEDNHFCYITWDYNVSEVYLHDGVLTYNLTKAQISRDELSSMRTNTTLELRIFQDVVGDTFTITTQHETMSLEFSPDSKPAPKEDEETKDEEKSDLPPQAGMTMEIFAWFLFVVTVILWVFTDLVRRYKSKKYIEAYILHEDGSVSEELEIIGEFKEMKEDQERNCYVFVMRKGKDRFLLYSLFPISDYLIHHKKKTYLFVRYFIDAFTYTKQVDEPYYKDLELTWGAKLYKVLCFFINISWTGVPCSILIFAVIFTFILPEWPPMVLIGVGVGLVIAGINYWLKENVIELKHKEVKVEKEMYISPLATTEKILNVYKVKGRKTTTKDTIDEAKETDIVPFETKAVGTEALYEMILDETVEINERKEPLGETMIERKEIEIVDVIRRKRNPSDIKDHKMQMIKRIRPLYEQILHLRETNARLQQKYQDLLHEKEIILEQQAERVQEALARVDRARKKYNATLYSFFERKYGKLRVEEDLGEELKDAQRAIQEEQNRAMADKIANILEVLERVLDLLTKKTEYSFDKIQELLEIRDIRRANNYSKSNEYRGNQYKYKSQSS